MPVKFIYQQNTDEERRRLVTDMLVRIVNNERESEIMSHLVNKNNFSGLHSLSNRDIIKENIAMGRH